MATDPDIEVLKKLRDNRDGKALNIRGFDALESLNLPRIIKRLEEWHPPLCSSVWFRFDDPERWLECEVMMAGVRGSKWYIVAKELRLGLIMECDHELEGSAWCRFNPTNTPATPAQPEGGDGE